MLVSIIIVNYNTFQITCNCIHSVIAHTKDVAYEIVLVDNASTKDNPDLFLDIFPNIILVKSPENGGFAKGNNLGIGNSTGDVILLLNSDTVLTEDSISIAAKMVVSDKKMGALTVRLVYESGKFQHYARSYRSIGKELLDIFRPILYLMSYKDRAMYMQNQYFKGDFDMRCDWVGGAFMMFRKDVLESLPDGKLDERFFMYGEDHLWCYQIEHSGYYNYFTQATTVIHIANASTEPSKQLALLKKIIEHELVIMKIRKGSGLYYYTFKLIYTFKEKVKLTIKTLYFNIFNKRID